MSKSAFLIFFSLISGISCMAQPLEKKSSLSHPNIIYILADDLGYGDVSIFNHQSKIKTKYIDQLASEGIRFTDAHSNSSLCTPSRYGILTGRYAWRSSLQNGVLWSYDTPLIAANRVTVASILKEKGYHTACIGKWHLGLGWAKDSLGQIDFFQPVQDGPVAKGFDYFFGISASLDIPPYVYIRNDRITGTSISTVDAATGKGFWRTGPIANDFNHAAVLTELTDEAVGYIQKKARSSRPFFLYLPLTSPHTPILPNTQFLGKSGINEYADFVMMTDSIVGRVMSELKKQGIEKNTLIIFTSDNGFAPAAGVKELENFGHYPSYQYRGTKSDIFEGGHRIPFIMKWPAVITGGSIGNQIISLTDFMATCAEIVGRPLQDSEGEDSHSMYPLMQIASKREYKRKDIIHHSGEGNFSIRKGKWKMVFGAGSGGWSYPTTKDLIKQNLPQIQLYDLDRDISETHNVVDLYPLVVKELTALMGKYIDEGRTTSGSLQANDVPVQLTK